MEQTVALRRANNGNLSKVALAGFSAVCIGIAPLLAQRFAHIDPAIISTLGYPSVFLINVLGSMTLFLPVPGLAVVFAGGSVLNPVVIALVAAAGMTAGMVACYLLGVSGSPLVQKLTDRQGNVAAKVVARVQCWFQEYGVWAAFLLAAMPNPFFDFAGLWAGAIRIPLWKFVLGTFLGKAVQTLVVALAGVYLAVALGGVA
ncbi:MAG: VTT domain-containing protein [Chloroflexi bacterium]|nr:VTT domain-containing protein [Chloroflexota bacterium]